MFVDYRDVFLTAADIRAFKLRFPDIEVEVNYPLKVCILEAGNVDFGDQAAGLSHEAKDTFAQAVLTFVRTRSLPDWLKEAQEAFLESTLSVLKEQSDIVFWQNYSGISLHDARFRKDMAGCHGSAGNVMSVDLSVLMPPFTDQDLEGVIKISPEWFEVQVISFGNCGPKLAKIKHDLESRFCDPRNHLYGEVRKEEFAVEKKGFYRLCMYRLETASNFLKRLVDDLNAPPTVTVDVAQNLLVKALAGTESQSALDMLGAFGLGDLPAPPFQDRMRVEKLVDVSEVAGRQLEAARQEMNAASSQNRSLISKLGAMGREQAQRKKDISRTWPSSDYYKLCQVIGLRLR